MAFRSSSQRAVAGQGQVGHLRWEENRVLAEEGSSSGAHRGTRGRPQGEAWDEEAWVEAWTSGAGLHQLLVTREGPTALKQLLSKAAVPWLGAKSGVGRPPFPCEVCQVKPLQ